MTSVSPLSGVTVFEIGHSVAAPFAGAILAQLGAEVIKVENPSAGDPARDWGPPFHGDVAVTFEAYNRDKSNLLVDLKNEGERAALVRLIEERADVVLHNLKPGSMDAMGLSGERLTAAKPSLIYCDLSAFGRVGPFRGRPGYDPLMQACGGLISLNSEPGKPPARIGFSVVDMGAGMWAAIGILAALQERSVTGTGGVVATSLYETALTWLTLPIATYLASGEAPGGQGSGTAQIAPYQAFQTADGYLMVAAGNDNLFARLCAALELPDLAEDSRFQTNSQRVLNRNVLVERLERRMREATTDAWRSILDDAGVPNAPFLDVATVVASEQTEALGIIQGREGARLVGLPLNFNGRRPPFRKPAPAFDKGARLPGQEDPERVTP